MPFNAYLDLKYDKRHTITTLYSDPFTITSEVNNCVINITNNSEDTDYVFKFSYDEGLTWDDLIVPHSDTVSINMAQSGMNLMLVKTNSDLLMSQINITSDEGCEFSVSGNIMTLIDATRVNNPDPTLNLTAVPDYYFDSMLAGAEDLIDASRLIMPATTVGDSAYANMFAGCVNLRKAPSILPATTLGTYCYVYMFGVCSSLIEPPILPATTLAEGCYRMMFWGCHEMTIPPVLPATTLANECYEGMFGYCGSLSVAPALPATTLADICYESMFVHCTSLVTPPALPATTLANYCYQNMFDGCTSLTTAPNLLASNMVEGCYARMFYDCESLNYIKILATDTATDFITNWVHNVASTGVFVKDQYTTYTIDSDSGVPIGWTVVNEGQDTPVYCTMNINIDPAGGGTAIGGGTYKRGDTVIVSTSADPEYDFVGWYDINNELISENESYSFIITSNTTLIAKFASKTFYNVILSMDDPELEATLTGGGRYNAGTRVTISASNISGYTFVGWKSDNIIVSNEQTWSFTLNTNMSLSAVYEESAIDYNHEYLTIEPLEDGCTFLIETYNLNALSTIEIKVNSDSWHTYTFQDMQIVWNDDTDAAYKINEYGTSNTPVTLNIGDKIQFRRLVKNGKYSEAQFCTVRFATSKKYKVYGNIACLEPYHDDVINMTDTYYAGTNLTEMYDDHSSKREVYYGLFSSFYTDATYGPKVVDASNLVLPFTTLNQDAYRDMFGNADYLSLAPALPATTLADNCYMNMFNACLSLATVPYNLLPATTLAPRCYMGMFSLCSTLTTTPTLPATTLADECYSNMFWNCSRLVNVSTLPATTLADRCYYQMFTNCTNLTNITCLATDISAYNCVTDWVHNVASNGTFTKAANMSSWTTGDSGIPTGWTVQDAS